MKCRNPSVILTGGGSGGHVIPALALLPELKKKSFNVYYVGGGGIEKRLALREGLAYYEIKSQGLIRGFSPKNLLLPFAFVRSVFAAKKALREIMPDVVFSKGGYAALPAVAAARLMKIPVVAHESDMTLGLANRVSALLGAKILTAFDVTAKQNPKFVFTGFPLRASVLNGDKKRAAEALKLDLKKPILLVVGGSGGSKALNDAVASAADTLLKIYDIVHIVGKGKKTDVVKNGYRQIEYSDDIGDLLALADVVISRSGAGAVSELAYLRKSAVLIPLPKGASRGDQIQNAEYAKAYRATVLYQENLNGQTLINAVNEAKKSKMKPLSPPANELIVDILYKTATTKRV